MVLYFCLIIAAFIVEVFIFLKYAHIQVPLIAACVIISGLVEFKSIAENITKATGVVIWEKLKGMFKRKLNEVIDEKKPD